MEKYHRGLAKFAFKLLFFNEKSLLSHLPEYRFLPTLQLVAKAFKPNGHTKNITFKEFANSRICL